MRLVVKELWTREAIEGLPGGPKRYISDRERGYNIYADTATREVVIDPPSTSTLPSVSKIRVPFENVRQYVAGVATPKNVTQVPRENNGSPLENLVPWDAE